MAWWNSLKDLTGDIKGIVPSTGSLIGSAIAPIGGLVGSAVTGNLGSDLGKGVKNAGAILGGVKALGLDKGSVTNGANPAGQVGTGSESDPYGDGQPGVNIDPTTGQPVGSGGGGTTTVGGNGGTSGTSGGWNIPGLPQGATQALQGLLTGGGLGKVLPLGLGAAQAINAANLQKQSTDYANKAYDTVTQSYNDRAPLRVAGQAGMLNPTPSSNVTGLAQSIPGNPFMSKAPLGVPPTSQVAMGGPPAGNASLPIAIPGTSSAGMGFGQPGRIQPLVDISKGGVGGAMIGIPGRA